MKLVIDIPEKIYECCRRDTCREPVRSGKTLYRTVWEAVAAGTPLPKGHGDLIDRSEVIKSLFDYHEGKKTIGQCVEDVHTIIEADKED